MRIASQAAAEAAAQGFGARGLGRRGAGRRTGAAAEAAAQAVVHSAAQPISAGRRRAGSASRGDPGIGTTTRPRQRPRQFRRRMGGCIPISRRVAHQAVMGGFPDHLQVEVDGGPAVLVDLSTTGAQLVSPSALKPNRAVKLTLVVDGAPVRLQGQDRLGAPRAREQDPAARVSRRHLVHRRG